MHHWEQETEQSYLEWMGEFGWSRFTVTHTCGCLGQIKLFLFYCLSSKRGAYSSNKHITSNPSGQINIILGNCPKLHFKISHLVNPKPKWNMIYGVGESPECCKRGSLVPKYRGMQCLQSWAEKGQSTGQRLMPSLATSWWPQPYHPSNT